MKFTDLRQAANALSELHTESVDGFLLALADAVESNADLLLEANTADCALMDRTDARYDRLLLTPERIHGIAEGIRAVAALPSPLNIELSNVKRPNGMQIRKVSVPFGVIGCIFEARPNVVFDVFTLCFKAGSACVLKGGHEAANTNAAAISIIRNTLADAGLPADAAVLLSNDHADTDRLLAARGEIDLIIPRGSRRLIDYVRSHAQVPVIETGAGVCHTYFHTSGDIATGRDIIFNAKTRRPGVCNALDCLVIDRARVEDLPALCYHLVDKGVVIHADDDAYAALEGAYPLLEHAVAEDYGREWLSYNLSIRTVEGIDEALDFIAANSSQHSECIVAENSDATRTFLRRVDAACVYANVSTAFTDGGEFGMGAEIGISTRNFMPVVLWHFGKSPHTNI